MLLLDHSVSHCGLGYHEPVQIHRNIQLDGEELVVVQYGPSLTRGIALVEAELYSMARDYHSTGVIPQEFIQQIDSVKDFWVNPMTDGSYAMLLEAALPNHMQIPDKLPVWHEDMVSLPMNRDMPMEVKIETIKEFFDKYPELKQGGSPLFVGQFAHHGLAREQGDQLYFHGFNRIHPFRISLTDEFIKITDWFDHMLCSVLLSDEEVVTMIRSNEVMEPIAESLSRLTGSNTSAYHVIRAALAEFIGHLGLMERLEGLADE